MFSLTINLDDPDKIACIVTLANIVAGDGLSESLPHNIVIANDWYLNCLSDRAHSLVDEKDEMLRKLVLHLRRAADDIEAVVLNC